ncbi:hypothetical protein ACIP1U_31800 [Cupriavidus sp. NPDC089707]|uniref:hypothetical protein n=1 Tax=Cupriavidus sp. NPDC089707 TaxID=3363963 RepID=UPI00380F67B1
MVIRSLRKFQGQLGQLLCVVFFLVSPISHANEQATSSRATRSSTTTTHLVTVGVCRFHLDDSLGGWIHEYPKQDIPSATYHAELKRTKLPAAVAVDFFCDTKGESEICREFCRIEKKGAHWMKWLHPDPDYRDPPEAHFTLREIKSINGKGAVSTKDETIGDEKTRARRLSFCLISPDGNVLIGKAVVDRLQGNLRREEKEVIKLLETIEFIESR